MLPPSRGAGDKNRSAKVPCYKPKAEKDGEEGELPWEAHLAVLHGDVGLICFMKCGEVLKYLKRQGKVGVSDDILQNHRIG